MPTFTELHAAHRAELLGFLARRLGAAEAEEVLQEVFLRAAKALPSFRRESSLRTWIFRLARNAAVDRIRQRRARPELAEGGARSEHHAIDEEVLALPSGGDGHEEQLIRDEMRSCIRERIEALPEAYREVLLLSEGEGLNDCEIASTVGASAGSVRVRLHRARARLREDLACHCTLYRDERNELACEPVETEREP
ncbi:MAG: sigma-70 family RNA polymerase sigma factor [Deltaproteobacteria bacterium]|nr:sigma-70 family RNA polymerase sigma factor [Deltaproteobacteria bacterium]